jgi:hypothetical protein
MKLIILSILLIFTNYFFSQTEELLARKIKRLEIVHFGISEKHKFQSNTKDSVSQIIERKKNELAPHFTISFLELSPYHTHDELIKNWFISYPEEYKTFVVFLEKYLRFNTFE